MQTTVGIISRQKFLYPLRRFVVDVKRCVCYFMCQLVQALFRCKAFQVQIDFSFGLECYGRVSVIRSVYHLVQRRDDTVFVEIENESKVNVVY